MPGRANSAYASSTTTRPGAAAQTASITASAQGRAGRVVRRGEEHHVGLLPADVRGGPVRVEAEVRRRGPRGSTGCRWSARSAGAWSTTARSRVALRPGPPNAWSSCWIISLEPLAAHSCGAGQPVAEVGGQVGAQRAGVPVRVPVQPGGGRGPPRRRSPRPARTAAGTGSRWCSAGPPRPAAAPRRASSRPGRPAPGAPRWSLFLLALGGIRARTASTWAARSSAPPRASMCGATAASAGPVVLDQVDAAQERQHGQAAGVPRGPAGGQHVVGAGQVVAERHRRVRADEDRARRCGPGGPPRRRCSVWISRCSGAQASDTASAASMLVHQHAGGLPGQRGRDPLPVPGRRHPGGQRPADPVGQPLVGGDQQAGGQRVVLGLGDQVRGDQVRVRGVGRR